MLLPKIGSIVNKLLLGCILFSSLSNAQSVGLGGSTSLSDNVANAGSPTLIVFGGQVVMYYVNHQDGHIYVDFGFTGGRSTNIQVPYNSSAYGASDVSAAVLSNGKVLISYNPVNSSGSSSIAFATSSDGVNFSNIVTPSTLSLGVPTLAGSPLAFPSALVTVGGTTYVATATTPGVYISVTTNGQTYTPFNNSVSPIFPLDPDNSGRTPYIGCKPSFTVFNGQPWLGYAELHYNLGSFWNQLINTGSWAQLVATVGNIITGSYTHIEGGAFIVGNNNRDGAWAGASLVGYNGNLYLFYQSNSSSQNLNYRVSTDGGASFPYNYLAGGVQQRWTPTAIVGPGNLLYVAYQNDGNTNISYMLN